MSAALIASVVLALLAKQGLSLSDLYVLKAACGIAVVVGLLQRGLRRAAGHGERVVFGLANQVTLSRAVLVVLLLGLLGEYADARVMWSAVVVASVASVSDAFDGWLARRTGTCSDFGARFDMEADAALIAVLALLAWSWDRAGMWVLLAGAARYVFVLGTCCYGWMRRELPPSARRKSVCVVQIVTLVLCMAPILSATVSATVAALGVVALLGSFMIDTLWLARAAQGTATGE